MHTPLEWEQQAPGRRGDVAWHPARRSSRRPCRTAAAALLVVAAAVAACGKKGPPLTPFVRIPADVQSLTAQRIGGDVYVTMTLPRQNIDGSAPASLARVEVYAATSLTPPPRARFLDIATLVATIPVERAADPERPDEPMPPADPSAGAVQGTTVSLRDTLTADELTPRELPMLEEERRRQPPPGAPVVPRPTALRRFYMAIPFNPRGVPGPPSAVVEMPLTTLPDPPADLVATLVQGSVTLQWAPSGGLLGWLLDQALAFERPPIAAVTPPAASAALPSSELPPGPTVYNVYRDIAPDPLVLPDASVAVVPWNAPAPMPASSSPVGALTFSDPVELDERQRCYRVRSVRGSGATRVESAPSPTTCVTPSDIYPPAAPAGLQTLPGQGIITLLWEPNAEADLGGYVVLRRDAAGDTLLTPTPIQVTRFTDRSATPGVRYTYEVRAVDSRIPLPNVSEPAQASDVAR